MYVIVRVALVSLLMTSAFGHVILCYYGSWAVYRPGNGLFDPEHLDPTICTHIIYSFLGVRADGSIDILDPWADLPDGGGKDGFRRFVALKKISPSTKIMISIGGWNQASTNFSPMVTDPRTRAAFVKNVVAFLKTHNFDGFDVNWEYPAQRGGAPTDVVNYIHLLRELKEAFEHHGYILTVSVAAAESSASISYDIPNVSKYADYIALMTYDLNGSWNSVLGIHAPLYPARFETTAAQRRLNVDACVTYWLNSGADPKKIVLGIPLYARTFTLANPENNTPGSAAIGAGRPGPYTQQSGFIGYNELCEKNLTEEWTSVWSEEQKVPYAYYGNQWAGYDNEKSIEIKSKYAISRELAGVMFWSVETDDFRGICHETKFPLIKSAYNILMAPSETTSRPDPINENDEGPDDTVDDGDPDNENDQSADNSEDNASTDNTNEVTTSSGDIDEVITSSSTLPVASEEVITSSSTLPVASEEVITSSSTLPVPSEEVITSSSTLPVTSEEVTTVKPITTTERYIISHTVCTGNSFYRHETDCAKFWQCVGLATGGYIGYLLECPAPLVFDTTLNVCNWARAVDCSND